MTSFKFRLQSGQSPPSGSTGLVIPGTDWLIYHGEAFPDATIEHEPMTDAEIEAASERGRLLYESRQLLQQSSAIKAVLLAAAKVIADRIRRLKRGEQWSDETLEELVSAVAAEL